MKRAFVLWQREQTCPGVLLSQVSLLPAEKTGSQHSDNHLKVWAGGMSLAKSPAGKERVGGGAEHDICQQQPGRDLSSVSATPGSAFRSSTRRWL